jgi:2-polyprenyl-3-methyl-5-hydroxy-6-metoxy-1,4-benzoquinol methylase
MNKVTVKESLQNLYDNYYDDPVFRKREITAIQTMGHLLELWGDAPLTKVLDVGAGEGSLLYQMGLKNFADELYGVEISESGVQAIKAKAIPNLAEILRFDGYTIPYPDKYFDLAISIHVLEHVEHERLFLAELRRVANHVLIEIPLENTLGIKRAIATGKQFGHINFYNVDTFTNLLNTSGLEVQSRKVFSNIKELELLLSNSFANRIKYAIRKSALSLFPDLAPNYMTYLCMAHCVSKVE